MENSVKRISLKKSNLWREISRAKGWYLFVLPSLLFLIIFRYSPLYFLQIAFRDFRATRPLENSAWVGFQYFQELFSTPGFWDAFRNTLIINLYKLLICFPIPIVLALLLMEIKSERIRRPIQTILYLPHFISWIVVASILTNLLAYNGGAINNLREFLGLEPIMFLGAKEYFRGILVVSDVWKEAGWSMIIYISALAGIDPALYEAADIDGANRWQKLVHITLKEIMPVVTVMLILRLGAIFGGSFDQVQALLNAQVLPVGDTLDTFIYRVGISNSRYSYSAAAGLFNSILSALFLFMSDRVAKKLGGRGVF